MKREIKFRGWDKENNCWRYGFYTKLQDGIRIYDAIIVKEDDGFTRYYIDNPETLGQYTGLRDAKRTEEFPEGEEVYEGSEVKARKFGPKVYKVSFIKGGFCLTRDDLEGFPLDINMMYPSHGCQITVI